ncbi:MAG: carbamoyltransferase N-terminal domain-containing protein [Bacillota bacterium]
MKLEKVMTLLTKKHINNEQINNICLAGGISLNCKMNGAIKQLKEVNELFIPQLQMMSEYHLDRRYYFYIVIINPTLLKS